jgi:hypothetical protein
MPRDWKWAAGLLALTAGAAWAQLAPLDPDWKESEAPPPPALRTTGLIALDMPSSALRFGVDPASVTLGADGIVRYVVVAQSPSGVVNAMYEGLHCKTSEVKVYARHNPDSGWVMTRDAAWMALNIGISQTRHSLIIARGGACLGNSPNRSAAQVVRDLGSPPERRLSTY